MEVSDYEYGDAVNDVKAACCLIDALSCCGSDHVFESEGLRLVSDALFRSAQRLDVEGREAR